MNLVCLTAIKRFRTLRRIVKTNHANVDVCARENPPSVAFREKDAARFLDAFEHFAVRSAPNPLRREQSCASALSVFDQIAVPRVF